MMENTPSSLENYVRETITFAETAAGLEKSRNLEKYSSSPRHYITARGEMPPSPDILSTKTCVELDLVACSMKAAKAEIMPLSVYSAPSIIVTPDEAIAKLLEDPCTRNKGTERLQPEGREKTANSEDFIETSEELTNTFKSDQNSSECGKTDDNLDGMLDRISHDLDYLLNRTADLQPEPSVPVMTGSNFRKISKPPASSIIEEITEENEEDAKVPEAITEILRTSC